VAGRVDFTLGDIAALYVPPSFLDRAAHDFRDLGGGIVALDPKAGK
jgi:hypothetical protein